MVSLVTKEPVLGWGRGACKPGPLEKRKTSINWLEWIGRLISNKNELFGK